MHFFFFSVEHFLSVGKETPAVIWQTGTSLPYSFFVNIDSWCTISINVTSDVNDYNSIPLVSETTINSTTRRITVDCQSANYSAYYINFWPIDSSFDAVHQKLFVGNALSSIKVKKNFKLTLTRLNYLFVCNSLFPFSITQDILK